MKLFKPPVFSIVINTYNRADSLAQTIRSLLQQQYSSFEIVIVNGPSTDRTQEVFSQFSDSIKVVECSERNLSVSRNIGIAASAGDIVAFIDDDALAEPEWLAQLAQGYDDEKIGATGGKVYDPSGYNLQYQYCTADRMGNAQWQLAEPNPELNFPGSFRFPYLQGTNTSFRRSSLLEIGGFDEEYEFYLDETDVCLRMIDAGYIVRQLPDAYVHHKFMPSHIRDQNRITRYRYPVVKNKIYFALKNARGECSIEQILEDALKFTEMQRQDVEFHITGKRLRESARETLSEEIEKAWEDGLLRGLQQKRNLLTQTTLTRYALPFKNALTSTKIELQKKRKSIVLVSRDYPPGQAGGIATFNRDMAAALAAEGHAVHVIAEGHDFNRVDFEQGVWVHRLLMRSIELSKEAKRRLIPSHIWSWSALALEETRRIAGHHPVDIVETPIWDCQGAAFLLQGDWPLVVSLQTSLHFWLETHPELRLNAAWMDAFGLPMIRMEKDLMQGCDSVRSISSAICEDIQQAYDFRFETGQVIIAPLGMPEISAPTIRTEHEKLTVLFVGRLEPRKGIDVLLEAIPLVLEQNPSVYFRIVGDDALSIPGGSTYRRQFEAGDVFSRWHDHIRFDGKVDEETLLRAYEECDIFTSPSRYESFGLIFLEAMRAGKPVIGCLAGGMPEIIEQNQNGLLVAPGDVKALSDAILKLADSPELRKEWGKRSLKIFLDKFTADKMASNSRQVYDAAVKRYRSKKYEPK
jgi:glycosyltransferase involved in cell wall biosynthesis